MKKTFLILLTFLPASFSRATDIVTAVIPKAVLPYIGPKFGVRVEGVSRDKLGVNEKEVEIQIDKDDMGDLYHYLKSHKMIKAGVSSESVICAGICGAD